MRGQIDELNADPACTGYIVQLPLPAVSTTTRSSSSSTRARTPTGCTRSTSAGSCSGAPGPLPVHAARHRRAAAAQRHPDRRRRGRAWSAAASTVGRPLGLLLTRKSENATVTLCHTGTVDLGRHTRGRPTSWSPRPACPDWSPPTWSSRARPCVDVGITRTAAGLVGDVDPSVRDVAAWVAPMPGGVGPMTRAMLLTNVVERAEQLADDAG